MLATVDDLTFREEVLQSSQPVLVNFWAPWCNLCRLIHPMLLKLQNSSDIPIKLVSINADENFKLANAYRLRSLPTLLFFEDGKIQKRLDNFQGRDGVFSGIQHLIEETNKVRS